MKTTLMLISLATIISLLFFACTPKLPNSDSTQVKTPTNDFGQTLSLKFGEEIMVGSENIKISFLEIQDSRCPKSVNCMMAGKAKVQFQIQGKDVNETIELSAKGLCTREDGSCGGEAMAKNYKVQLINVYPFPIEKTEPKEDNIAKIVVTK